MLAASGIPLAVTIRVLALEVGPVPAVVPHGRAAALGTLGILACIQGRRVISAARRRADEPSKLTAGCRAHDSQHALMCVPVRKDVKRAVPEDPAVEDCDLFVHASAQIHRDAQVTEDAHQLADLVRGATARLARRSSKDAHSDAAGQRRADRVHPAACAGARREWREDDDGLPRPGEISEERGVEGALGESAGSALRELERGAQHVVEPVHPVALGKWKKVLEVELFPHTLRSGR